MMAPSSEFMKALHAERRAAMTHFKCGHEITSEDTYTRPDGARICITCRSASQRVSELERRKGRLGRRAEDAPKLFGLPLSFWQHISESADGCWNWGSTKRKKYGRSEVTGPARPAYHLTYEALVGSIPPGLELDHLCCNQACVNPEHLEPVTHAENMRRYSVARKREREKGQVV